MYKGGRGPTNSVDVSLVAVLALSVTVCLLINKSDGLPTKVQHHRPDDSESLSSILRDLESVVFRLKEYALRIDYESRKTSSSEFDFEDPSAEINEKHDRYMLEDTYPELVAGLHDKKSSHDSGVAAAAANQMPWAGQQDAMLTTNGHGSEDIRLVGWHNATGQNSTSKPSSGQGQVDDISLREALEYLVSLAKQKKQEQRDHDIPFPLTNH